MYFKQLRIKGYRGFSKEQILNLAEPSGESGSGLTIIVGPNNSGKSTIYEAIKAISLNSAPSFTEGKRNIKAGDKIAIVLSNSDGNFISLKTNQAGGSETEFLENGISKQDVKIFTLPSRRTFNPFFGKGSWNREQYISYSEMPPVRGQELSNFSHRLFAIQNNQKEFNEILKKVISPLPEWYIDQNDSGQYYIKFNYNGSVHNSDGVGEGIISVFTIVDTLYDSKEGDVIFIDEPELSLHPSMQRKMADLLVEFAKTRQIIISTHSPFFIDWTVLINGAELSRTVKVNDTTTINQLSRKSIKGIESLLKNFNNPHILGLNANEVFFLNDNLILVEGQEDVIFFKRIMEILEIELKSTFFGWGAGGASNMEKILNVLKDLNFKKITVILDNNVGEVEEELKRQFPEFQFSSIPTDDVRDKPDSPAREGKTGLIDRGGKKLKEKYIPELSEMFNSIKDFHK